ncbi:hypothetical protein LCM08_26520 [Salipiger pacificus]|nr:hypothetical protein [Alloyangia pacifica]
MKKSYSSIIGENHPASIVQHFETASKMSFRQALQLDIFNIDDPEKSQLAQRSFAQAEMQDQDFIRQLESSLYSHIDKTVRPEHEHEIDVPGQDNSYENRVRRSADQWHQQKGQHEQRHYREVSIETWSMVHEEAREYLLIEGKEPQADPDVMKIEAEAERIKAELDMQKVIERE